MATLDNRPSPTDGLVSVTVSAEQMPPVLHYAHQTLQPFTETSMLQDAEISFDASFAFNIADFPYVPEPAQTHLSPQGTFCPQWTSTELDAWIGTIVPPSVDPEYHVCQNMPLDSEGAVGIRELGCNTNHGPSIDAPALQ